MKVLVIGGAGYIGSHTLKALLEENFEVLTFDNFSTGHKWSLLGSDYIQGDLSNFEQINEAIKTFMPHAVVHFAASIQVGESVQNPLMYYANNVKNTINLLEAMARNNIMNIIFSSSAAIYGNPLSEIVNEDHPQNPINPYGQTKAFVEKILSDMACANQINYIALRYFNAAGADKDAKVGQAYQYATHLITRALKAAKGELEKLEIFGTDYSTFDGTCIRDYIHVDDLAKAHLVALRNLLNSKIKNEAFNVGYSHGYSVKEVVEKAKKVTGIDFKVTNAPRRPGDPPYLIADNSKIKKLLNWQPQYDDLEYIIKTAWNWEKNLDLISKNGTYAF